MNQCCSKKIKHTLKEIGIYSSSYCGKPIHENNLCVRHHKKQAEKLINWGDRSTYRNITQAELIDGGTVKLKSEHIHRLYRYRFGVIQQFYSGKNIWVNTNIEAYSELFCKKI